MTCAVNGMHLLNALSILLTTLYHYQEMLVPYGGLTLKWGGSVFGKRQICIHAYTRLLRIVLPVCLLALRFV